MVFFVNSGLIELMVLDGKSWQGFPVNADVPQGSLRRHTHFLLYINNLPNILAILFSMQMMLPSNSKCDWLSDLWQQLDLVCELKFELR